MRGGGGQGMLYVLNLLYFEGCVTMARVIEGKQCSKTVLRSCTPCNSKMCLFGGYLELSSHPSSPKIGLLENHLCI